MRRNAGSQFDPHVVGVLLALVTPARQTDPDPAVAVASAGLESARVVSPV